MAGVYIHIPFCRQACHYCDFHFSTDLRNQSEIITSVCKEIEDRKDYIKEPVETIYFGGGTPSLLTESQIIKLLETIRTTQIIEREVEITLEANPEDLSPEKTGMFLNSGINRLSLGAQTFDENRLDWLNRIHSSRDVVRAFENARMVGFTNISLDLIYAIPSGGRDFWQSDLQQITALNPEHVSLYGLTVEEKTVFGNWLKKRRFSEVPEETVTKQYLNSIEHFKREGYLQYEVSNFSKEGFESRHNSSYWDGKKYLGVGPGAHSFDGDSRQHNIRNNAQYIKALGNREDFFEREVLSKAQKINEQILIQLRRLQGLDLSLLKQKFGIVLEDIHQPFFNRVIHNKLAIMSNNHLRLLPKGFLVADEIALRLFFDE